MSIGTVTQRYQPSVTQSSNARTTTYSQRSSPSTSTSAGVSQSAQTQRADYKSWMNDLTGAVSSVTGAIDVIENADKMKPADAALSGAQAGAGIGSWFGGWGAAIGGAVGAAVGFFKSVFGHKDPHKEERKAVRAALAQNTSLGPNLEFEGFVGNGQRGVISLHGKNHKVDNSGGVLAQATGLTNVLATAIAPGNSRLQSEVSAMFLNAISGAQNFSEALASVQSLTERMGMTPDALAQRMVEIYKAGAMSKDQLAEHLAYIDILAGIAPGPSDEAATDGDAAAVSPAEEDAALIPDGAVAA